MILLISPNLADDIVGNNRQSNWFGPGGPKNFAVATFTAHWVVLHDANVLPNDVQHKITTWGRTTPLAANTHVVTFSKVASWCWGYVAGDPAG